MKTKQWVIFVSLISIMTMLSVGIAEGAGVGTLMYTFQYQNPTTGIITNLPSSYIYLHNASNSPPLEKYFSKADFIGITSNGTYGNGLYLVTGVPAGTWYIRITQRQGAVNPLGPPQNGDYTWFQPTSITIVAGQTLNLGTLNATIFGTAPITITGTITNYSGAPKVGVYVRAQTEICIENDWCGQDPCLIVGNQCGPVKIPAQQPTDANGKYTIYLRDPGTYYIYTFTSWNNSPQLYGAPTIIGFAYPEYGATPQSITVNPGDNVTANIISY
jgi:hypothetical protein